MRLGILKDGEMQVLAAGVALTVVFTLWMILGSPFPEETGRTVLRMSILEITLGRAATMSMGYSEGLGLVTVVVISAILETILVLIFYPLFVLSWRQLLVIRGMKRWFERMHEAADIHKDKVQKFGLAGLFVFVWLPFWMTGPAVGCVIGFLLGLRAWVNMGIVLGGTYVAIFGWAFVLKKFDEQVSNVHPYAGVIIIVGVIVLFAAMRATAKKARRKR